MNQKNLKAKTLIARIQQMKLLVNFLISSWLTCLLNLANNSDSTQQTKIKNSYEPDLESIPEVENEKADLVTNRAMVYSSGGTSEGKAIQI